MADSIAAANNELAIPLYSGKATERGESTAAAPWQPEGPCPESPSVTFVSPSGCTLTMAFKGENAAPRCGFTHCSGCRCRPAHRMIRALPLTNYLVRVLVKDSHSAQEPRPMTHRRAWEAMSDVLFHRRPVSTGVPDRYSWKTRLRVKAIALELMWALEPESDAGADGPQGRALGRFAMNVTEERRAQEPRLARVPRLLADLGFAPVDSTRFRDIANQLISLGKDMVDAAAQHDERAREWFVRLLTGFNITIYELAANRTSPLPDLI